MRSSITFTPGAATMTAQEAAVRLDGCALILGAASGFGAATAAALARAAVALSHPDTHWITGNVIGVDGGEDIVG